MPVHRTQVYLSDIQRNAQQQRGRSASIVEGTERVHQVHIFARGEWQLKDLLPKLRGERADTYFIYFECPPATPFTSDAGAAMGANLTGLDAVQMTIAQEFFPADAIPTSDLNAGVFSSLFLLVPITVVSIIGGIVLPDHVSRLIHAAPDAEFKLCGGVPVQLLRMLRSPVAVHAQCGEGDAKEFSAQLTRLCASPEGRAREFTYTASTIAQGTWDFLVRGLLQMPECTLRTVTFDVLSSALPASAHEDLLHTFAEVHARALDDHFLTMHVPILSHFAWGDARKLKAAQSASSF